jgi:hypothetical protein
VEDTERRILYGGLTLSCCLGEVFGDTRQIELEGRFLGELTPTRPLDLRRSGSMRAGLTTAVAKIPDREATQRISRSIYEHPERYAAVDGLIWLNAHNDEDAWALYERAEDALTLIRSIPLGDPLLAAAIADAAIENSLDIPTP